MLDRERMRAAVDKRVYLGDGLYAVLDDGVMIRLEATREFTVHWVALEPEVFVALLKFAEQIGWGDLIKRKPIN